MSADDFDLPSELEALLLQVCAERGVPARRHDEIRSMVQGPRESWPACCGASCEPCVEENKEVAREVLARWFPPGRPR